MLTIYKASAGSGKTYRLALRYVKLLLGEKIQGTERYRLRRKHGMAHRSILAVTFTNKATEEMKHRIVHELAVLAQMEPGWTEESPYLNDLISDFGCSVDELREASRQALDGLLNDFSFFQVSTIDSFFQTVLRAFAYEADLTGNYDVDLDDLTAIKFGVHNLLGSLGKNDNDESPRMLSWVKNYMLSELSDGVRLLNRDSAAYKNIVEFIAGMSDEVYELRRDTMEAYLSDFNKIVKFEKAVAGECRRLEKLALDAAQRVKQLIERENAEDCVSNNFKSLLKKIVPRFNTGNLGATIKNVKTDPKKAFLKASWSRIGGTLLEEVQLMCATVLEAADSLTILRPVRGSIFALGLFRGVMKHMENYRSENNMILLSDTNTLLHTIIDDSDTPFVYERLGVWLHHFLIDEFQDTSKMQWVNLLPLLRESQSKANDNLIIGDEKQCIYRFRQSDPTLLQYEVEKEFPKPYSEVVGVLPSDNTNYRSSSVVVNFNNALFRQMAENAGFSDLYGNVCQAVSKRGNRPGYVAVNLVPPPRSEFRQCGMEIMVREMERQLRSGYKPSDILVLTSRRKEGAAVIDYLLKRAEDEASPLHGVRVISEDVLFLDSSPAVKHIVSKLRALESSDLYTSKRQSSPRQCAEMINRFEYHLSRGLEPEAALQLAVTNTDTVADVSEELTTKVSFNLPSLVEAVIRASSDDITFSSQQIYISAFQDVVEEFCTNGTGDLYTFMRWWDNHGSQYKVAAPENEDAISVMTIHKSKGLEAPCLHLPMVSGEMVSLKSREWFDLQPLPGIDSEITPPMMPFVPSAWMADTQLSAQYEKRCDEARLDMLNLLYVAFTRAKDELIASVCVEKGDSKIGGAIMNALATLQPDNVETMTLDYNETDVEVMTFGEPTQKFKEKKKESTALDPARTFVMPKLESFVADRFWNNLNIDDQVDIDDNRDFGVVLHDVMRRILHPGDLHKAVVKAGRRYDLSVERCNEIEKYLSERLNDKRVAKWFEGFDHVLSERTIINRRDSNRRPDRVVCYEDGSADVVDYKFGKEEKEYIGDVERYMRLVGASVDGPVRGYLWYVDSMVIREVIPSTELPID